MMNEHTVHTYNVYKGGELALNLAPVNCDTEGIQTLDHNGTHLSLTTGYAEGCDNWQEASIAITLTVKDVTALRDLFTAWLEGKWAGVGVQSLPEFPVDGLKLEGT